MIDINILTEKELIDLSYDVNQKLNQIQEERKQKRKEEEEAEYSHRKLLYNRGLLRWAKKMDF